MSINAYALIVWIFTCKIWFSEVKIEARAIEVLFFFIHLRILFRMFFSILQRDSYVIKSSYLCWKFQCWNKLYNINKILISDIMTKNAHMWCSNWLSSGEGIELAQLFEKSRISFWCYMIFDEVDEYTL